jgi:hypothetical protein
LEGVLQRQGHHSTLGYLSPMAFEKKWLGDDKKIAA